jgi:RNA polymerase sigma factor (sigma-70 family)
MPATTPRLDPQDSTCDLFLRCVLRRGGDDWSELLDVQRPRIRGLAGWALRRGGFPARREDVDDVEQEIYCRLLTPAARRFRGRSGHEVWVWLSRVAQRLVLDWIRRERAAKRRALVAGDGRSSRWLRPGDRFVDPEERLLRAERRELFFRACGGEAGTRGELRRTVVRLAFLEGRSSSEIAALVGLSPASVDALVHRLRRSLAAQGMALPRRAA